MLLNELDCEVNAVVSGVIAHHGELDGPALRRLESLGFIPGEPVRVLRRGPGGREPLAVVVGDTMFGLRLLEAQCIEVVAAEVRQPAAMPVTGRPATA